MNIIFDTDPGIDDAIALLLALRSPELNVIGVTSVFGNVDVAQTTRNALHLLAVADRVDIPVARGAAEPLVRPFNGGAPEVHGEDGLGNSGVPAPSQGPIVQSAAQFIVEQVLARPGEITLVAVGPLTNLALRLAPAIAGAVRQVVLMGGAAFVPGNVSPVAEANIRSDPEAAAIVFGAGWPLVMVGLDVTNKIAADEAYVRRLAETGDPFGQFIAQIAPVYFDFHRAIYNVNSIHVHDPAAIAFLLQPTLFQTEQFPVQVVCGGLADAQIIVDRERRWLDAIPIAICVDVDAPSVLRLLHERLSNAAHRRS